MGNSSGNEVFLEDLEDDNLFEEVLEPLSRSGFVSGITEGITSALEVLAIASIGTVRVLATQEDDDIIDEYSDAQPG